MIATLTVSMEKIKEGEKSWTIGHCVLEIFLEGGCGRRELKALDRFRLSPISRLAGHDEHENAVHC
jgi:hypothetical protein